MTYLRRKLVVQAAKLYDLTVMSVSFGLAAAIVAHENASIPFTEFLAMRVRIKNFLLFAIFLLVWNIIFRLCRLYDSKRLTEPVNELRDIFKATTLGVIFLWIVGLILQLKIVTPSFTASLWLCSTIMMASSRLFGRYLLSHIRIRGRNLREMVIVGTNHRALLFARQIKAKPSLGYRLVGFVDQEWEGMGEFRKAEYALASDFEKFPSLLRERVVDEVVVALPMKSLYLQASRVAALCQEQGIVVRLLPNFFNLSLAKYRVEEVENISVMTLSPDASDSWQHLAKRVLDFTVSLVSIIALVPVFVATALLIKLTSFGPILFVQKRVGLNKRKFQLYKFRTMVADAEERQGGIAHLNEASGPVFKIKNDPRITPLGKFLRKASIDELPQLFNVLQGNMSLVGPRPLPVRDYEGFRQDWQRRRFSVPPGITCLWQINGRSSLPFERWMQLDLEYIDQWSLWMDLKILAKTIPAVLRGVGAA